MTDSTVWNPGFPVIVYEEGMELPSEGTYYVVAGNGNFLSKDTGICRAFVPVQSCSSLPDLEPKLQCQMKLPKIKAADVRKLKAFFQDIVEAMRTESASVLFYNRRTKECAIHIPPQMVSYGGVRYARRYSNIAIPGFEDLVRIGTIHSHCDFGAFHSNVDDSDEFDDDGLHITFGHNHAEEFDITASNVVNGKRFVIAAEDVLEGIVKTSVKNDKSFYKLAEPVLTGEEIEEIGRWFKRVKPMSFASAPNPFKSGDQVQYDAMNIDGVFTVAATIDQYVMLVGVDDLVSYKMLNKVEHVENGQG